MESTEKNSREETPLCQRDDASGIKLMSELEHIQLRPGMYIGRLGNGEKQDDGIYSLLKNIIDNSVDEYQICEGREIEVTVTPDNEVTVRDHGKGIPFEYIVKYASPQFCTGGRMCPGAELTFPQLGVKIVNALSKHFTVISRRGGMSMTVTYENGVLKNTQKSPVTDADGTDVIFKPSERTFPGFHYRLEHLRHWMWHYVRLHPGLHLVLNSVEQFFCDTPS